VCVCVYTDAEVGRVNISVYIFFEFHCSCAAKGQYTWTHLRAFSTTIKSCTAFSAAMRPQRVRTLLYLVFIRLSRLALHSPLPCAPSESEPFFGYLFYMRDHAVASSLYLFKARWSEGGRERWE
jgi:hypothetical protein